MKKSRDTGAYSVGFWPIGGAYSRPVDGVNKRTAKRVAKRLGIGAFVTKLTTELKGNNELQFRRSAIDSQPCAPMLKNGKRMDRLSYFYHCVDSSSEKLNISITPWSEVA